MRTMLSKVFVYGSLKRGFGNHQRLVIGGARFIGPAVTKPIYTMVDLGAFPGVITDGETEISGELYEVDGACLQSLDSLEGHPNFYRRALTRVYNPYNRQECWWTWIYVLVREPFVSQVIANGVWPMKYRVDRDGITQAQYDQVNEETERSEEE